MPSDRAREADTDRNKDKPQMEEQMAELMGLVKAATVPIDPRRGQTGLLIGDWEAIVRNWLVGLLGELTCDEDASLQEQLAEALAANRGLVRRIGALEQQLKGAAQDNQGAEEIAALLTALQEVSEFATQAYDMASENLKADMGGAGR